MYNMPFYYNYNNGSVNNALEGVCVSGSPLSRFFQRHLLQRAISVFKWKLPEHWSAEYFLYSLYSFGYVVVVNTDAYGVIPQACGLHGYDVMYRPTNAIIANPLLSGIKNPRIGVECSVINLQPDFGSVMDLVTFYADMMALSAQTAGVNIMNSRLSYVFTAGNKAAADSFKVMYDQIASGKPAVFADKTLMRPDGSPSWEAFQQNVGQNYIAGQIIDDLRKWEQRFDTAIGISNSNTEKKERLIVDEVNSNNEETKTVASLWLEQLQKGVEKTNKMFNLNISVDWRNAEKEVYNHGLNSGNDGGNGQNVA